MSFTPRLNLSRRLDSAGTGDDFQRITSTLVRGSEQYFELVFRGLSLDLRPKDTPIVLWGAGRRAGAARCAGAATASESAEQSRPCRRDESRYAGPMRLTFDVRDVLAERRFSEPEADLQQRRQGGSGEHIRAQLRRQDHQGDRHHPGILTSEDVSHLAQVAASALGAFFLRAPGPGSGDLPVDQIFW